MGTWYRYAPAVVACALLAACGGGGDGAMTDPLGASQTVVLRAGAVVAVGTGALTLKLTDVRDSRCPVDATCVWAGHASVAVQAAYTGQAAQSAWVGLQASAGADLPGDAYVHGWRLRLQALEPAPRAGVEVPLEQYRATVVAERTQ